MLKQSTHQNRILFLELFTRELIANSKPKEKPKIKIEKVEAEEEKPKEIEKPKIKKKLPEEIKKERPVPPIIEAELTKPIEEEFLPSILPPHKPTQLLVPRPTRPTEPLKKPLRKPLTREITPVPKLQKFTIPVSMPPRATAQAIMGVNLGKLNIFITDKAVSEIECPGPNKSILVKKAGRVNLTKISLSQEEINKIIEDFSEKARIPVIGGIFKAVVGNLIITAIISEFVGSRFIIYKRSPYSLIEQTKQVQQAQFPQKKPTSKSLLRKF